MTGLYILIGLMIVVSVGINFFTGGRKRGKEYQYKQKDYFMSRAEHECYDALMIAVGDKYHIFPQVHLPSIVDKNVIGQNWKAAFWHINQKSVDFVLCDKVHISPKLAIELDDRTHERDYRKKRDREVERILRGAELPLLRLENHGSFNPNELAEKINTLLNKESKPPQTILGNFVQ